MVAIIPIVAAVRRHKQQREVQAELQAAREERQQAALERQQIQEMLQAHMNGTNTNQNSGYPPQEAGYGYQPATPGYTYPPAEPLGMPVEGIPVQNVVYATNPSTVATATTLVVVDGVEYCSVCESYHALPHCHMTRREQRREQKEERRELRREQREERREERRERRDARRNH